MPFQFRKEAIEEDLNSNFPSQGQGNPPLYYSLSEVVVPTYSINSVTEGSGLAENLQTAWDFSTGHNTVSNATTTVINNTGFWKVSLNAVLGGTGGVGSMQITDGLSNKTIWRYSSTTTGTNQTDNTLDDQIVFLRTGDSLVVSSNTGDLDIDVWYRQIATLNGTLVNPLGFSFA